MRAAPIGAAADHRRFATVAVAAAGASWIGAAGWLARNRATASTLPVGCPFRAVTGLDCPGCGSTRSLGALTQLDLGAALDHNVVVPFALAFVLASFAVWTAAIWRRPPSSSGRANAPVVATDLVRRADVIVVIGIALALFTVLRNLDAASWLASGLSGEASRA